MADQSSGSSTTKPTAPVTPQKRRRTPSITQMETTESGAVALAIVLGYYGLYPEMAELRVACGTGRDGAPPERIASVAQTHAITAEVHDDVNVGAMMTMPTPLIALTEGGQYVVVEGYTADVVYVNNPAAGAKTYTRREFKSLLDDTVITLAPGAGFKKAGKPPSEQASLLARLRGNLSPLLFVLLASLGLIFPLLITPLFAQVFIDDFLSASSSNALPLILVGMVLTSALMGVLTWLQSQYLLRLQLKMSTAMSAEFFWHVLRLPIDFFIQRYRGEIGSRLSLNDQVAAFLTAELTMTVVNIAMAILYLALMIFYDLTLTLVVLAFGILNIVVLRLISQLLADSTKRLAQQSGKLQGVSMNGIQTIETLKATGRESDFFARWTGLQANVYTAQQQVQTPIQILNTVPALFSTVSTALILVIGGLRIMDGDITVGMLVAFQSLAASFLAPVGNLLSLGSSYQDASSAAMRLDDLLKTPTDPLLPAIGTATAANVPNSAPKLSGKLELRNITFGYDPYGPPLLENFSLSVEPGSRVALVGGTGSGKSTIANLVVGLYAPWSGDVLFDGKPRTEIPHSVMTASLAKVDQSIFLFDGTVNENLSLWDSTVPQQDIVQAARDAAIHDVIAARTGGYVSAVAEGGTNFSGGQAQRLEIARSLVFNPSILILDEATSALDPPTEAEIDRNLRRRGCTCLIVAHRLSTIRDCDEIIVLEYGKVVQRGTHDEMYRVDGFYRTLIQAQTQEGNPAPTAASGDSPEQAGGQTNGKAQNTTVITASAQQGGAA